jgi:hypothetical protein
MTDEVLYGTLGVMLGENCLGGSSTTDEGSTSPL